MSCPNLEKRKLRSVSLCEYLLAIIAGSMLVGHTVQAAPMPGGAGGMGPMGPGGGPGGPGGGPGGKKDKKEGPAEEAPKDKEALRPIETIPAEPPRYRKLQLFELHGYMRMRGDYFHRLNLSNSDQINNTKFFRPPAETLENNDPNNPISQQLNDASCLTRLTAQGVPIDRASTRCNRRKGFPSANMRLRLEPTLRVTDTISVHAQIDALDNVVLGSTPDSYGWNNPSAPIHLFTRTQTPPTAGTNSFRDSIVVKRAYGHIRFGWGLDLQFGRRPWEWGMGVVANGGNGYDRNERGDITRMLDMDYGDSVDSIRFAFELGKDKRRSHVLSFSWDWAASGPTTSQLLGPAWDSGNGIGQDFSAEKFDNVYQWSLAIERRDDPSMLRRKLTADMPVVNYGFITWARYQDVDMDLGAPRFGNGLGTNPDYFSDNADKNPDPTQSGGDPLSNGDRDDGGRSGLENYSSMLIHRRALVFTPDLWLRVNWRTLRVELEMAGNFGRFYRRDFDTEDTVDRSYFRQLTAANLNRALVLNFGYALEFKYGLLNDQLHLGLDHGFATGDGNAPLGDNSLSPLTSASDRTLTAFRFNPAYMQDLLLFREVLGTVSNAAYFKPWAAFYFFGGNFSGRLDVAYALAQRNASTVGRRTSYGVEIDGALRYHDTTEPIFFQLQYGVLFPLGAFNKFVGATVNDAKAAQTVQAQVGIRF